MGRLGKCIYWMVLFALFGCVKENNAKKADADYEYLVSGELLIHPSILLLEFVPINPHVDGRERYFLGPVNSSPGCVNVRCGIYRNPKSLTPFYPIIKRNIVPIGFEQEAYSVELRHTLPDTLLLEISFSGIKERVGGCEMTEINIRLPFVRGNDNRYRSVMKGLPLQNVAPSRSGAHRFFVDMDGLFM